MDIKLGDTNLKIFVFLTPLLLDRLLKLPGIRDHLNNVFINKGGYLFSSLFNNPQLALMLFGLIIVGFVLLLSSPIKENKKYELAILVIVGALISNVIDRIFYGGIIDYIFVDNVGIFNLADVFVLLGVGVIILETFRKLIQPEIKS